MSDLSPEQLAQQNLRESLKRDNSPQDELDRKRLGDELGRRNFWGSKLPSLQNFDIRQWLRFCFWQLLRSVGLLLVLSVLAVAVYRFAPVPFTPLMVIRTVENLQIKSALKKVHYTWMPISRIQPRMQSALIASEDANFLEHSGFDFEAIDKAFAQNRKSKGRTVKGASTITQQVAKNLFLWPSRSWVRKILEAYFTVLIELFWSKERILEVYMNVIETGDNVYGVESAARYFYKKRADALSADEAALIAAVLPNPRKFRIDAPSPYTRFRRLSILRRMQDVTPPFPHKAALTN